MNPPTITLDVRDDLRQGKEPMAKILAAARALLPGQELLLRSTFEPIPLFRVLGSIGLEHTAKRIAEGDWEVTFRPRGAPSSARAGGTSAAAAAADAGEAAEWPAPSRAIDNRGLLPPEPMMRVLDALEKLGAGAVLEVFSDREPVFLYPELAKRGVAVRIEAGAQGVLLHLRRAPEPT